MVKIEISNRTMYFLVAFGVIALFAVGVFAVAPNPGHTAAEIEGVCGTDKVGCDFLADYATRTWVTDNFEAKSVPDPDTTPTAPSGLTSGEILTTSIDISWLDNSDDETSFEVQRDGSTIATLASERTSYADSGLASGTTYVYRVRACNSAPMPCSGWTDPELTVATCADEASCP